MLSLATVPAALLLAATSWTLGAGAPVVPASIQGHCSVAGVSDPDPAECPFCGGNPTVHVKVLWQIQKYAAQGYVNRLL
jgi:hypothetical protein